MNDSAPISDTSGSGSADPSAGQVSQPHVLVVGAGLAGLACCHRLVELTEGTERPRITLLDCAGRAGGAIATRSLGDYRVVDSGADMFITDKPWARELCERLGIADQLRAPHARFRRSLILRNGEPLPVPEGFALMAPGRLWPMVTTQLLSPLGKLRMAADLLLPRKTADSDESIASFVRRRLGQQALERLVQPLVGGIYTGDPEKLSLRATLPRFIDMEQQERSLVVGTIKRMRRAAAAQKAKGADPDGQQGHEGQASGARYGLFVGFPDGMQTLIDALQRSIAPHVQMQFASAVQTVAPAAGGGYRVDLRGDEGVDADAVVLATPAYRVADMVGDHHQALARRLRSINYASSALVLSGHQLADIRHPMTAFGMVVPAVERRRILAVSFASRKFDGRAPDGRILLRTFVGGALQPEMLNLSDDQIQQAVREELGAIFGVTGKEDFMDVVRYTRAMPQYEVGHLERVAAIEATLRDLPGLELAGSAYRGVGIPDVIHSGEGAAERIHRTLSQRVSASNLPTASAAKTMVA